MTSAPGIFCKNRLFEWGMAAAMLQTGVELVIWPDAIARSKLQFMLDVVGSPGFTAYYLFFGMQRIAALCLNSAGKPWTAYCRSIGALAGAFAWCQMAISLIIAQIALQAPPSPTVPLLLTLGAVEIYSAFRALDDARYR